MAYSRGKGVRHPSSAPLMPMISPIVPMIGPMIALDRPWFYSSATLSRNFASAAPYRERVAERERGEGKGGRETSERRKRCGKFDAFRENNDFEDGYKHLPGAELNENDVFKLGNYSCTVTAFCMGTFLTKMAIFIDGKYSCMVTYFWFGNFRNEKPFKKSFWIEGLT